MRERRTIYIAGRYPRRDEFRVVRDRLNQMGFWVSSRWLDENEPLGGNMGDKSREWYYETQRVDLEDVEFSDYMLFFSEDPLVGTPRGGRHVEFGYALAMYKQIFVIGPRENLFHYSTRVKHFNSIEDFYATQGR